MVDAGNAENIIEQLKSSIQTIIKSTGADSQFTKDMIAKIQQLQNKLETLPALEKIEFGNKIRESLQSTVTTIEEKVRQTANFEKVYRHSIFAALIFIFICITVLYVYKMFKIVEVETVEEIPKRLDIKKKKLPNLKQQ